jgi:hypothetical protein
MAQRHEGGLKIDTRDFGVAGLVAQTESDQEVVDWIESNLEPFIETPFFGASRTRLRSEEFSAAVKNPEVWDSRLETVGSNDGKPHNVRPGLRTHGISGIILGRGREREPESEAYRVDRRNASNWRESANFGKPNTAAQEGIWKFGETNLGPGKVPAKQELPVSHQNRERVRSGIGNRKLECVIPLWGHLPLLNWRTGVRRDKLKNHIRPFHALGHLLGIKIVRSNSNREQHVKISTFLC